MGRIRNNELTVEDKLEIRTMNRNKKQLGVTTGDIAEKFGKSRQTISQVINDKSLAALETKDIVKEENKLVKNNIKVLENIYDKVLTRLDSRLDDNDIKSSDLIKAIKEVGTQLQLLAGKPTSIKEERKLSVDMNVLTDLPEEKLLEYLSGGDINEIESETNELQGTKTIEISNPNEVVSDDEGRVSKLPTE